jgi:hypothetical protein
MKLLEIVFTVKFYHYLLKEAAVSWKLLLYDPYISFFEAELLMIPYVLLKYRSWIGGVAIITLKLN